MNAQVFGKYQLLKKLATGGMAEVFLARKQGIEGFNKLCVVKRILPHLADDPEFVQMFLNEAKIAARFSHPNIAQIDDLGETNGTYFIAMEFVHGEDLGRVMRKAWSSGQWIARPLAIRVVASACEGLHYAHTKTDDRGTPMRVVHRDISPQNILISFDGSVKVVDFGIAKAADAQSMTRSGAIKGKFAYMSPEQAAGKPLDHRSDIFALGLVLYELLTGVRPLKRDSELATLQAALECHIEPPSKVADVPEELDPIVMAALSKSADDRYRDARALQMALEEFLVSQRWVATSVQVAELMTTLFKDRLDEEARTGMPDPVVDEASSTSGKPVAPAPPAEAGNGRSGTQAGSPAAEMSWEAPPATQAPSQRGGARTMAKSYRESRGNAPAVAPPDVPAWEAPPATVAPSSRRTGETRAAPPEPRRTNSSSGVTQLPPPRSGSRQDLPATPRRSSRADVPVVEDGAAEAAAPRRTRSSANQVPRTASRGSNQVRRRTGEVAAQDELRDDESTQLPDDADDLVARRRSGQYSLGTPKRLTNKGEMPEAPLPAARARADRDDDDDDRDEVSPSRAKARARPKRAESPVDPAARARTAKLIGLAVGLVVLGAAGVVFRKPLSEFLNKTANDGAEIYVSVDSNLQTELFVVHHPDEGRGDEQVYLGRNPLKKVGGVHVRDTLVFESKAHGLRHEHEIPYGQPGEHKQITQNFERGSYVLNFEPKSITGLKLFVHGQEVGNYPGPKLDLVQGKHTVEVRGAQLKQPAQIEIEVKPGETTRGKVFNLSSLML